MPPIYECAHGHAIIDPPTRPTTCPVRPNGHACGSRPVQTAGAGLRSAS